YIWGVPWDADILVGGAFPASGITVNENYTYRTDNANTMTADIGSYVVANQDVVCTNNYFVGGFWRMGAWSRATVAGNTLYNFTSFDNWLGQAGLVDPGTYAGRAPAGVKIVVRANQYEPGRANIIIYNWAQDSTVSVDVSGVLTPGDQYVVQNAQDFYGSPIASGTYSGGTLQLPVVSVAAPSPIGVTTTRPAPVTGPTFNVFALMTTPGRAPAVAEERAVGC